MVTSLMEMLELARFFHMATSIIQLESSDKILLINKNYDAIIFISKNFILRKIRVANFADIIKIVAMFIKTNFEDSNKVRRIRNNILKCNLNLYFLI